MVVRYATRRAGRTTLRAVAANDPPLSLGQGIARPAAAHRRCSVMRISSRFLLDGLFVVAAAFLTVASMAWSAGPAGWTAFGVSTGIAVLAVASVATAKRNSLRVGHGLLGLVALWSLVAALAFSGTALTWLVFADAIPVCVLALADLAVHEATTERIVHSLEVRDPAPNSRVAA